MEAILGYIQTALNWVNDPTHKTILWMIGGWALNRWPAFVNKAIPGVTTAASIILGTAQLIMAAVGAVGAHPANYTAAVLAVAGQPSMGTAVLNAVVGTILPVWIANGHYSWLKNLMEWAAMGLPLFRQK